MKTLNRRLVDIRSADAAESLSRIEESLERARNRRSEATMLKDKLNDLYYGVSLSRVETLIGSRGIIAIRLRNNSPDLVSQLNEGERALSDVRKQLAELLEQAKKLTMGCSNSGQLTFHSNKTKSMLVTRGITLRQIECDARQATHPSSDLLKRIEEAKPLWGEHIETVAGMVLRDDSFDDGLCVLADQIVRICAALGFGATDTLNILGRHDTVTKELNYAVFFRFPAWSIWGLPLIAHEFWHASCAAFAEVYKYLKKNVPQTASVWDEPFVQECLADTFATYVIGPAYAFATILLLLDADSPADRVRAKIVFSTLEKIAREAPDEQEYFRELKECWDDAAGMEPGSESCYSGAACHLASDFVKSVVMHAGQSARGNLNIPVRCTLADEKGICPMTSPALIYEMQDALLKYMDFLPKLRYPIVPWLAVDEPLLNKRLTTEAKSPFEGDPGADNQEDVFSDEDVEFLKLSGADLRHVLHCAWRNRWKASEQDAKSIGLIGTRAREVCNKLIQTKQKEKGRQEVAFAEDPNDPTH